MKFRMNNVAGRNLHGLNAENTEHSIDLDKVNMFALNMNRNVRGSIELHIAAIRASFDESIKFESYLQNFHSRAKIASASQ